MRHLGSPPKISLKHDWMKELGSEVARQPEGEVARQAKSSQPSQPNPNPDHDRTGRPVVCPQRGAPRSETRSSRDEAVNHEERGDPLFAVMKITCAQPLLALSKRLIHVSLVKVRTILEEDVNHDRTEDLLFCPQEGAPQTRFSRDSTNFILKEETNHDRTGRPVVCRDAKHERSMLNEVDIDFRIPGLPHSVVKQADNYRVRELVKMIENHPHRQALQRDLQQNNAYNPFSETSKKMIKDMGNVELFELFETDPKTQCKECLLYWSQGICLLHLRASLERK